MTKGYFLYHLNKTRCGGRILSGASDTDYEIGGIVRQQVRVGDPVTCGKHKGLFRVCGGMGDTYEVGGVLKEWAGSLDSFSSCPCRARFVPTVFSHYYESDCNFGRVAERAREEKKKALIGRQDIMPENSLTGTTVTASTAVLVFAKSVLRGAGNTDAGTTEETQTNIGEISFYQSSPSQPAPEPEQHAQAAKKKTSPPPEPPKKKSLFDKVTGFFFGEAEAMPLPPLPPPPVVMGGSAEAGMAATAGGATAKANQDAAKALTYQMKHLSGPAVWESRFELNLPFVVMGAVLHSMLKSEKSDLLTAENLLAVAQSGGTVPTRVRYNWVEDSETGRLKAVGYHTSPESGRDQVKVRLMEKRFDGKYRFWGDDSGGKIHITWTPADAPGSDPQGWNSGNDEEPVGLEPLPGLEYPDIDDVRILVTPVPEERDFRDYILVFPGNVHPPIYIYLSKPPVELLEVELYIDFNGRSRQGEYEADHIPSAAAVRLYYQRLYPDADEKELEMLAKEVAAIVIPKSVHRKISETYGGRNREPGRVERDSRDLRVAADRNFDVIKTALKESGITEEKLEAARAKIHELNESVELYKK